VKIANDRRNPGPGKTVLVVDDNPGIRDVLAAAFLSNGFKRCVEVENGKEGIEAAEQIKPDIITLAYAMPVMSGLEAAPVLRKLFPKTPIILFTLYGDSLFIMNASRAGVSLVLPKNVSLPTLLDVAHELTAPLRASIVQD
jgi:CheY-like chemotaxis protein